MSNFNEVFEEMKIESAKNGNPKLSSRFILLAVNVAALVFVSVYGRATGWTLYLAYGLIGLSTLTSVITIFTIWLEARNNVSERARSNS